MIKLKPLVLMMACASGYIITHADDQVSQQSESDGQPATALETIRVVASADASATGLMEAYAGGQVASGGRVGIFGNQKNLDTPFN